MDRSQEKAPRKKRNNLDESPDILNYNRFASLNTEEITEDEDFNGSIDEILSKLKTPKKKNARRKNNLQTKRTETIKNSFECKGSTLTFRCHICNKLESILKAKSEKRNKSEAKRK